MTHCESHMQGRRIGQPIQMPPLLAHRIAYRMYVEPGRIARSKRHDRDLWVAQDIQVGRETLFDLGGKVPGGRDDGAAGFGVSSFRQQWYRADGWMIWDAAHGKGGISTHSCPI